MIERLTARLIWLWFEGERNRQSHDASRAIQADIDAAIATMPEPLPMAADAWKQWVEFERWTDGRKNFHTCMELCSMAEWAAKTELGLTDEPFEGVPRITISPAPETATQ